MTRGIKDAVVIASGQAVPVYVVGRIGDPDGRGRLVSLHHVVCRYRAYYQVVPQHVSDLCSTLQIYVVPSVSKPNVVFNCELVGSVNGNHFCEGRVDGVASEVGSWEVPAPVEEDAVAAWDLRLSALG